MPAKKSDTKVIPNLGSQLPKSGIFKDPKNYIFFGFFFGCFLILLIALSFLPLPYSLKVIALIAGTFLIEDLHRSIKGHFSSE